VDYEHSAGGSHIYIGVENDKRPAPTLGTLYEWPNRSDRTGEAVELANYQGVSVAGVEGCESCGESWAGVGFYATRHPLVGERGDKRPASAPNGVSDGDGLSVKPCTALSLLVGAHSKVCDSSGNGLGVLAHGITIHETVVLCIQAS
jgi:hypothetical protein